MAGKINWSAPVSKAEMARRAAGRRRYHRVLQLKAEYRRKQLAELLARGILAPRELARRLQVHPSTISRDKKILLERLKDEKTCPICGGIYQPDRSDSPENGLAERAEEMSAEKNNQQEP